MMVGCAAATGLLDRDEHVCGAAPVGCGNRVGLAELKVCRSIIRLGIVTCGFAAEL
jgi:hypothetical protein